MLIDFLPNYVINRSHIRKFKFLKRPQATASLQPVPHFQQIQQKCCMLGFYYTRRMWFFPDFFAVVSMAVSFFAHCKFRKKNFVSKQLNILLSGHMLLLYFVLDHFAFIIWAMINGEQKRESVLFVLAKNCETVGSILCEYCSHPPMNHVALHHHDQGCKTIKITCDQTLKGEYSREYSEPYQSNDTTVPQNIEIDPPCPMMVTAKINMKKSFKSTAHRQVIATIRRTLPTKRLSQRSLMLNEPTCLIKIKGCKNFGKL